MSVNIQTWHRITDCRMNELDTGTVCVVVEMADRKDRTTSRIDLFFEDPIEGRLFFEAIRTFLAACGEARRAA